MSHLPRETNTQSMDARAKSLVIMPQIAEALRGLPSVSVTGRLVAENIGNAAEAGCRHLANCLPPEAR